MPGFVWGHLAPDKVVPISFAVDGLGEIAAAGNANPRDVGSFKFARRDTFYGPYVTVVRPTGKPGAILVRAESPGLGNTSVKVDVTR